MGLPPETKRKRKRLFDDAPPAPPSSSKPAPIPEGQSKKNPLSGPSVTDKEGLQRAYSQGDAYARGDTLYIAGSHTAKDWYDDVTKVPFWGDLKNSTRYQQAEKALKANPSIKNVVGHSLGGSVALELQKNRPALQSRTFGAPVFDPLGRDGKVDHYRNLGDPFSIFDRSATNSIKWTPLRQLFLDA